MTQAVPFRSDMSEDQIQDALPVLAVEEHVKVSHLPYLCRIHPHKVGSS